MASDSTRLYHVDLGQFEELAVSLMNNTNATEKWPRKLYFYWGVNKEKTPERNVLLVPEDENETPQHFRGPKAISLATFVLLEGSDENLVQEHGKSLAGAIQKTMGETERNG